MKGFLGGHDSAFHRRVQFKRSLPRPHFIGTTGLEVIRNVGQGASPIVAAVQESVVSRGVQPIGRGGIEEGMEPIAIQNPGFHTWVEGIRSVVLGPHQQTSRLLWVNAHGVPLGDLKAMRHVMHPGIVPHKHSPVVAQDHIAVGSEGDAVLVGMRVRRFQRSLPVHRTRPSLSSVRRFPHVDASDKHPAGVVGIHCNAQIPKSLSAIVCTRNGVAEQVGASVSRGFCGPRQPAVDAPPKREKTLLKVVAGHGIQRVRRTIVGHSLRGQLNASHTEV